MKSIPFSSLPIDSEFLWGGFTEADMNWGRKRSSRTAVYRRRVVDSKGQKTDKLANYTNWGYFGQNEIVYIAHQC